MVCSGTAQLPAAIHAILATFDPGVALSGAVGATVGALVGVAGTATVAYRARKFEAQQAAVAAQERIEQAAAAALDRAVENLLSSLVRLSAATEAWQQAAAQATWLPGNRPSGRPNPGEVSIAVELVKLRALKTDRDTTDRLSDAWNFIIDGKGGAQSTAYGLLLRAVVAWRADEGPAAVERALRMATQVAEHGAARDDDPTE